MSTAPKLGVCYYPEHWPRERWAEDAMLMREAGISFARIGEFAWSRIEPEPGRYDWSWLDEAVDTLAAAGLQIVMGTPTACPPQWLVAQHPDILPHDEHGRPRGFGSRRHYCFSSARYLSEAARIVTAMAERYGGNKAITGWQLDNEYGCHETTAGLSPDALFAFRDWLRRRHGSIEALNDAWGTVFWSQEYHDFDAIGLPFATVTEANPAHRLDHWRFSSEQVAAFNRLQAGIVRRHAPESVWLSHNFMGNFIDFDHHAVGADIDVASWDSYPLGFLDTGWFDEDEKQDYRRTGHPDWAAFHHDLYRGVGGGRFGVMEQQPGPVNWAASNAAPLPGMVRLWTLEAFAHGAEFVSYFRWRQAPFAQEQMHAGLRLPDGSEAPAWPEVVQTAEELEQMVAGPLHAAPVALVLDYECLAMLAIQPHGEDAEPLRCAFDYYSALRSLDLDIDIVPATADLSRYELAVFPCNPRLDRAQLEPLANSGTQVLVGARSGSRTATMQLPANLPPGELQSLLPLQVIAVDALRPGCERAVKNTAGDTVGHARAWLETVRTELHPIAVTDDGHGVWFRQAHIDYLAVQGDGDLLRYAVESVCRRAGIDTHRLPEGLRCRRRNGLHFAFNYGPGNTALNIPADAVLLGSPAMQPGDVTVWRAES